MTDGSVAAGLTGDSAEHLAQLLEGDGHERLFLHEVLELWRSTLELDGIAAYVGRGDALEKVVGLGSMSFPARIDRSNPGSLTLDDVGGGFIAHGRTALDVPAHLELLAAAALRLCICHDRLKQYDFDAKYRGVELEAIYDVGLAMTSTFDLGALAEEILLRAVSLLDARRGGLFLLEDGSYRLQGTIGGTASSLIPEAIDPAAAEPLPGAQHLLIVPIEVEGERRGLLAVADKESRTGVGPFTETDAKSLAHFANQAALALEQARLHREALEKERLEREMELASQIQRGILPRILPEIPGYEFGGWTRPARHVGGDYYDQLVLPDGRVVVLVADVSGKGVPAALLVSTLHSALRLLLDHEEDLATLGTRLNSHLFAFTAANKYATLFVAVLEVESGRLAYLNAGHNPGLIVRDDGGVQELPASGVPVGLLPIASYECGETHLGAGDLLCLYSDGFTEAMSKTDEEFGLERLVGLVSGVGDTTLDRIRRTIEAEVADFSAGLPQGDDQTLVLLRRER